MQDVLYIEEFEKAAALMQPLRLELLKKMAEPCTCTELGQAVRETPQKVYYHVKVLEEAGIVEKVSERRVRGIVEGIYQAKARSYWLSPQLVGHVGGRQRAQDQMSLGFLFSLAEELQADVGHLGQRQTAGEAVPSLGLSAQIHLRDAQQRAAFLQELQSAFQTLAQKYGSREGAMQTEKAGQSFRVVLACYPQPDARPEP
jgi:DNA-binding transcriptional ArsR family regulator